MSGAAVLRPLAVPSADAAPSTSEAAWQWPIDVSRYDRSPPLTAEETRALARLGEGVRA